MQFKLPLLALPASLLFLCTSQIKAGNDLENVEVRALQWPYNLPPHARDWPKNDLHRRRDVRGVEAHFRLGRTPVGVMKMSDDPGEKFYMEYWQFEGESEDSEQPSSLHHLKEDEKEDRLLLNAAVPYRAAFALHINEGRVVSDLRARGWKTSRDAAAAVAILNRQGFACPTGTSSCSSIDYPDICCANGQTCYPVEDTASALGPVGCCPDGASCSGSVSSCPSPNIACPDDQESGYTGGGCCMPGYVCAGVGCAVDPSLIVTKVTTQVIVETASSSTLTTSTVDTFTSTQSTSQNTALQTTLACQSGFHACPVNLGGGCCTTDRVCGSFSMCMATTSSTSSSRSPSSSSSSSSSRVSTVTSVSSATGVAPIRPTSVTLSSATLTTTCPVGFYACEVIYNGGCCQTGMSCGTNTCFSTTTILSSGVTVVVPVGPAATIASHTGSCAPSWTSCAASVGGNCCPSGWGCGTASCSSVGPSTTLLEQKDSPSAGMRINRIGSGLLSILVISMLLM